MLVTNQPEMVEAAKVSYRDFPTALNAIGQSNKTYKNEMSEYAKMDITAQSAQLGIGLSSNLAQLSLSYLWSKKEKDDEYWELYHNCIILATLAQVLIDGIKRSFEVDAMTEVERIQNLPSMQKYVVLKDKHGNVINDTKGNPKIVRRDLPMFMQYIKEPPRTKNGRDIPYDEVKKSRKKIEDRIDRTIQCPMNYLQKSLDKIHRDKSKYPYDILDMYIRKPGRAVPEHMSKIRKIVEEYDAWTKLHINSANFYGDDDIEPIDVFENKSKEVIDEIKKIKIGRYTMNRLIGSVLGIDKHVSEKKKYKRATKYTRKMMNMMYRYDKTLFLSNFVKK